MKPQSTDIIPESIQLDSLIETGDPDKATSQNATIDKIAAAIIQAQVINCAPVTPSFRPSKPDVIAPSRGNASIDRYILSKTDRTSYFPPLQRDLFATRY